MAGIKEEKKIYLVGIYCRLSKDDGTDNESASIATQKSILADYVKKQGWHIAKTYVDDGYSGTNFQRPSFQNMIKDIENGLINCVITKDLSRLGIGVYFRGLYAFRGPFWGPEDKSIRPPATPSKKALIYKGFSAPKA